MMSNVSVLFSVIGSELTNLLKWVRNSNRMNITQFPEEAKKLKLLLMDVYTKGRPELQPGGLDAFTCLETSISNGKLISNDDLVNDLLESVLKCFKDSWKRPVLISLHVEICCGHLKDIRDLSRPEEVAPKCKKILDSVSFIISCYQENMECAVSSKTSTIVLCLYQIQHNLPLLINSVECKGPLIKQYTVRCLMECFEQIQKEFCENSDVACSEFIDLMDSALNIIHDVTDDPDSYVKHLKDLKFFVDELLCHAMSTAQVTNTDEDKQSIVGVAQKILKNLETLRDDVSGEDAAATRLAADSLGDSLCILERTVNAAVLRLVLLINITDPVRSLVSASRLGKQNATNSDSSRSASDLDEFVMEFDAHMDRLMQIGTFAVSCSSNIKKSMMLRSYMTTFQALEAELVPCVTALYLENTRNHKSNLQFFVEQWDKVIKLFRNLLNTIIDPTAYTDVVNDRIKTYIRQLDDSDNNKDLATQIILSAGSLEGPTKISIEQDFCDEASTLTHLWEEVKKAIDSCNRAKLRATSHGRTEKLVTRAKAVGRAVENLLEFLSQHIANSENSTLNNASQSRDSPILREKRYYTLCPIENEISKDPPTPYLARSLIEPIESEIPRYPDPLTPHLAKSRNLLKTALLYNTPKRSTAKKMGNNVTPVMRSTIKKSRNPATSVARSRCFRSSTRPKLESKELSDMELTALLQDITSYDSTFSLDNTLLPKKGAEFQGRRLLDLFAGWDSFSDGSPRCLSSNYEIQDSNVRGSTCVSNEVETPERVNDLLHVERRIENLKSAQK